MTALQAQQQEAEEARRLSEEEAALALELQEDDESYEQDPFQIYGFMDMGVQRLWVDKNAGIGALMPANAWTFVVGNIDLYFDFNPHPDWRGLTEVRFSNAPHGRINNFGGPFTGEFERETTQQYDPNATVVNAQMWRGSVVIERAWIEWDRYQALNFRMGSFFTPFGIWNVDHGSPTLIATAMPQFIQMLFFPQRQTGVQAHGSLFAGGWELAYRAWLTNGRQELDNVDFDDDKALGSRVFARTERGSTNLMFGASYHHGRVRDRVVDITEVPTVLRPTDGSEDPTPDFRIETDDTWAYVENVMGADISVDIGRTRIRAEGVASLRQWEDGKRPPATFMDPGATMADHWRFGTYGLVAHQLPFWGLEPYLYGEVIQQRWDFPDGFYTVAPGFNVRFTPSAMLKVQGSRSEFFDWMEEYRGDTSENTVWNFVARAVLAF
jgi:hypothetical protein